MMHVQRHLSQLQRFFAKMKINLQAFTLFTLLKFLVSLRATPKMVWLDFSWISNTCHIMAIPSQKSKCYLNGAHEDVLNAPEVTVTPVDSVANTQGDRWHYQV